MNQRTHLYWGAAVSLIVTALVVAPAFSNPNDDSFPLSTFPMFSRAKRDPGLVITQVLAVRGDGRRTPLPPELSTGNEEVIQAMRMIHDGVYGDRKRARAFCEEIAERVRDAGPEWEDVKRIEFARSHFDTVAYFEKGPEPITRKTLKQCEIAP